MTRRRQDPSSQTVLIAVEEFELLSEVLSVRRGRLLGRVIAVHHQVIGYTLLIGVKLDGDGEVAGPEIDLARELTAELIGWVQVHGQEVLLTESKRHMPEWRPPFNPEWDA